MVSTSLEVLQSLLLFEQPLVLEEARVAELVAARGALNDSLRWSNIIVRGPEIRNGR